MATPNPMEKTYPQRPTGVSKQIFSIAGILTTVYGLEELNSDIQNVACLWLLHPRLQNQSCMEPIAASTINDWNRRLQRREPKDRLVGLIAVSFDQRNHGSREVDKLANEAWRSGNPKHAPDMFSIYHGTSIDTSHLINYVSSYAFPDSDHIITTNMVCGISLGGHAAWHCILHDPRITTAVLVIGCPDYTRLMCDRAKLSKLQSWTSTSPPGSQFLGSKDFPLGLMEAIGKYDPAGLLCGQLSAGNEDTRNQIPSEKEKTWLIPLMKTSLQSKRILNLAGGADKLVPYRCGEPFLRWLKAATAREGWFGNGEVILEDKVFEGVGHEMSSDMVQEAIRFIGEALEKEPVDASLRASKI